MITTQTTLAEVFKIMTDSSVNIFYIDLDVDDVPVRFKIRLTARGYESECKNDSSNYIENRSKNTNLKYD